MKFKLLAFSIFLFGASANAQELNCTVEVITPQIQGTQTRIFETLENVIFEFMNSQKWTGDVYNMDERIECSLLLTITDGTPTSTEFKGNLQIQSFRPVYNSSLKSQVLNMVDENIEFSFQENSILRFTPDYFTDNLTSVLAYYAYMILGYDYDTFSLEGGSKYYSMAQQVVNNAQNASFPGWKAFEDNRNRYWLVDNVLHQSFQPFRELLYTYHRKGLDVMYDDFPKGRSEVIESLKMLKTVHQIKPLSYNATVFFLAKHMEIINVFSKATAPERNEVYEIVERLDPGNLSKYGKLK